MTKKYYEFDEIFTVLSADCKDSAMTRFHKRYGVRANPSRCREAPKAEVESKYPWVKSWDAEDHGYYLVIGQSEFGREWRAMATAQGRGGYGN